MKENKMKVFLRKSKAKAETQKNKTLA